MPKSPEDTKLEEMVKKLIKENNDVEISRGDVDDEGSERGPIAKLGPNATTTIINNKINEIINEINKSLIDNRI